MNESRMGELGEATRNMLELARVYASLRRGPPAAPAPAGWRWCTKCRDRLARRNQRWCARCRTRPYDNGPKPWERQTRAPGREASPAGPPAWPRPQETSPRVDFSRPRRPRAPQFRDGDW